MVTDGRQVCCAVVPVPVNSYVGNIVVVCAAVADTYIGYVPVVFASTESIPENDGFCVPVAVVAVHPK